MSTSTSGVASSSEIDDGGGDLLEAELPGGAEDVVSGEDLAGTAIRDDGPVLAVMAEAVLDRLEVTLHSPLFAACGRRGDLPPPFVVTPIAVCGNFGRSQRPAVTERPSAATCRRRCA